MKTKSIIFFIILAVLVYVFLFVISDIESVYNSLIHFESQYWFYVILIWLTTIPFRIIRSHIFLQAIDEKIPFHDICLFVLAGYALSFSPARIGEVIRSFYLKKYYNIPIAKTAPIVIVERIYDVVGMIITIEIMLFFSSFDKIFIIIPAAFFIIFLVLIKYRLLFKKILLKLNKIKFFRTYFVDVDESYMIVNQLFNTKMILIGILITLIIVIMEVVSFYLILTGLGENIKFSDISVIFQTSQLLATASGIPGGIGILEGGLVGMLVINGINYDSAFSSTIIIRFVSTIMFSAIGVIFTIILSKRKIS